MSPLPISVFHFPFLPHRWDDRDDLLRRLDEDGYLCLRGFHDRDAVRQARDQILERDINLHQREKIAAADRYLAVVESPKLMNFFDFLLDRKSITFDEKWVRQVKPGASTGAHMDIVYMGRGSKGLMTCWTPLDDIPIEKGTLVVAPGSHKDRELIDSYGQRDVDIDKKPGWLTTSPRKLVEERGYHWVTSDFQMGDIMVFGMYLMHCSTVNTTDRIRVSCDTRYQLASEPVDLRWVGNDRRGHA